MKIEEIIGALIAGMIAGAILTLIEQQFPEAGVGRI